MHVLCVCALFLFRTHFSFLILSLPHKIRMYAFIWVLLVEAKHAHTMAVAASSSLQKLFHSSETEYDSQADARQCEYFNMLELK